MPKQFTRMVTANSRYLYAVVAMLFASTQIAILPTSYVLAEEKTEQTSQAAESQGPSAPQGPSANTYVQNQETGLWENEHYTWDPNTGQTAPKIPQDYSYNPATGMWDTTEWEYVPESQRYEPNTVRVIASPPASDQAQASAAAIQNTGPNSNNTIQNNAQANGTFNLFYNANITNNILSTAVTGDALVVGNTKAGSALTGSAANIANVLNMLQSSWHSQSPNVATFLANFEGDIEGDLQVDPDALLYALGLSPGVNLDINESTNAVINNNIDLASSSGDAKVSGNTTAGDATSGDALALVNLINMINSHINSNRSFIGMINILGNLNGDILIPSNALNAVIATTGPNSNNQINQTNQNNLASNTTTTNTISNNVNATANSGDAVVENNTTAGDGRTGLAETTVNTLNLVGQNISAPRALLVFVNVLGQWYGLVFGDSSSLAAIDNTGPNSNNQINSTGGGSIEVNSQRNNAINNNVNVRSESGDAKVSGNTIAGNATSGDASATVNLLNLIDSQITTDDWFGVLFINILGDWFGSFGADTPAGNGTNSSAASPDATSSHLVAVTISEAGEQVWASGEGAMQSVLSFFGVSDSSSAPKAAVNGDQSTTPNTSSASAPVPAVLGSANNQAEWLGPVLVGLVAIGIFLISRIVAAIRNNE